MLKLTKRASKKAGLPPGSLLHIGEKKTEKVGVSLIEPRKRAHSPLLAAGLASESENEKLPYGEDSPVTSRGEASITSL